MRIGITGGAGYIASHVIQDLLELGHEITVIDNMSSGNPENIFWDRSGYNFLGGDIMTPSGLDAFFAARPEIIFHFAASKAAGESMEVPEKYAANNLRGTLGLLERMVTSDCRYFIFSSSAAVYGNPRYLPIDEEHPLAPENYYGYTKKAIEDNLAWFSRLKNIRFAALRYFNAAGYDVAGRVQGLEFNPRNLLPIVMEVAAGQREYMDVYGTDYDTPDGTCIRDYIHINDLASGHVKAMQTIVEKDKDLIVNLGSTNGLSVQEMVEAAREITGRPIPTREVERRAGDPAKLVASSERALREMNWKAEHSDARTLVESMWKVYSRKFQ